MHVQVRDIFDHLQQPHRFWTFSAFNRAFGQRFVVPQNYETSRLLA